MQELNSDSPEVDESWLIELRLKRQESYPDLEAFTKANNIRYLDAFWFFKGNPVVTDSFKRICEALGVDWEAVQNPKPV